MKIDFKTFNQERKSNTYYSNTRKRDQQNNFAQVLLEAMRNISKNHRLYIR
jgi:hypothetical protein